MKAAFVLATVAAANAALLPRQLENIPQCALSCALSSLSSTGCATTDFQCICTATAFISGLVPCVQSSCSASEYDATLTAAQGLCSAAGATLVIPSGAVSTSAGATSSASSAASSETSAATTSAPATTVTSVVTTSASTVETTSAGTSTGAPTTSTRNGTVSTTSPPQPTGTEPGAASRNTIALSGLGAVVALVAAFL